MPTYTAPVGSENAAWLASKGLDGPLAGNDWYAEDNGDGTVTFGEGAFSFLASLPAEHDGCIEQDETGCRIWIEGDPYPVTTNDKR